VVTVSELTMPKSLRWIVTFAELPLMTAVSNSPGTPESQLVRVVDDCQSPVPVARHVSWAEAGGNLLHGVFTWCGACPYSCCGNSSDGKYLASLTLKNIEAQETCTHTGLAGGHDLV
jgi:hypothetical protein